MKTIKEIFTLDIENKQDALVADRARQAFMEWMAEKQDTEKNRAIWLVERDKVKASIKQREEELSLVKEFFATLD